MRFDLNEKSLEGRLFLFALFIALPYLGVSIFFDLISLDNPMLLIIDVTFFVVCFAMLLLQKVRKLKVILINSFCVLAITGLFFYWTSSGGVNGGGAYVFPVISVLVILITRGVFRIIFSVILATLTILLGLDMVPAVGEISYDGLLFDYVLNLFMLSILLILFKTALDRERNQIEIRNAELFKLNETLQQKTKELEINNERIQKAHDDLRGIVQQRTRALEEENARMVDFAFINAHLVRAPLANIIGLIDLIVDRHEKPDLFFNLKKQANLLDDVLHKIGGVLKQ